ncbi:MAG: hypothetical protein LC541_18740 [Candidatus Thiodiazotropha sp.]|nr:hypothetical protein [Candidatus Thiodiazotropha sp.]MCM8885306.1 hypothetical protein [Candidatus Thiodiazotropha sp.]MCM8921569.1 hypothetical protein [Candidatus Thiodiazotropha sp.]
MSQERFFVDLAKVPRIANHWDQDKQELRVDDFEADLGVMSSGEAHLARFFAGVWLGQNKYQFDATEAAASLDTLEMELITSWMKQPYWP